MGPGPAILLQAVPFAYLHIGKPALEAFSTPFGGAAFGFVAWRSRSFLYAFLIHWFMIVFLELAASGRI
jgi:membrane protease YdiL (CAAX protease family)